MKKYDEKTALPIIIKAAKEYDEKLNDKHFMIVYQDKNEVKISEVGFRDMNFLHLTGVSSNLSATMFYSACISGKLSIRDFSIDSKGKAQRKLMVLPYLPELLYNNCMIGKFSNEIKNKLLDSLISKKSNGEYNLCQAIKEMKEEAREEGIRQGEYLGKVKVLREINWTVEMIAKQINLSEQEVENIIQKIEKSEN